MQFTATRQSLLRPAIEYLFNVRMQVGLQPPASRICAVRIQHESLMQSRPPGWRERRSNLGPTRVSALIVALTLVLVAALWLIVSRQIQSDRAQAELSAVKQNQARAEAFRQYVLRTLDVANIALNHTIAFHVEQSSTERSSPLLLNDPTLDVAAFAAVTIQRGDRVIASTRMPAPVLPRVLRVGARNTPRAKISRPFWSPESKRSLVAVTRSFNVGSRSGLVSVWVEPRHFTDFSDHQAFSANDLISLIGLDGITRARRTGSILSSGEDLTGKLVMRMQKLHPNGTYLGPSSIDQIPRYFSHRRLPGYPLFVTSGVSVDDVLEPLKKRQKLYIIELLITTFAIVVGAWVLTNAIGRNFRQVSLLADANQRLIEAQRLTSMGDWDYELSSDRLRWSETLCEMYGREPGEAVSSLDDVEQYVYEENNRKIRAAFARICATGKSESYDLVVQLPGGVNAARHIVAVARIGAEGVVIGVHGTDQDMTERRRIEVLEAQLSDFSRMDAMNALAATLAHELNQPLAAAANYLAAAGRVLRAERVDAKLCSEILASASQQIHDTGDIIRGARELVSNEPAGLSATSLVDALNESITLIRGLGRAAEARIERDLGPACNMVLAKPAQLRQVFFNLLKNAIEAAGQGTLPRINVSSCRENEDFIRVVVRDNGRGLDEREPDPFAALSTTKATGLGLGLSISRTIVEAHSGRIWIESSSREGTSVGFTLRAAPSSAKNLTEFSTGPVETPT